VAQLYPRAGSLSVASYDSQGCGGGILTRLHTGRPGHKIYMSVLVVADTVMNLQFLCKAGYQMS
jgi:hypothetical protein